MKRLAIGNDHAGFDLKMALVNYLNSIGYEVKDYGTYSTDRADYPDFAHPLSEAVEKGVYDLGILICGSGNGISMTANKHQGIRAALCWKKEIAELARLHNNANILALPARYIEIEEAKACLDVFLATEFEGGRHEARVEKISC
jgi:ribose 5-phosphate isomerase B